MPRRNAVASLFLFALLGCFCGCYSQPLSVNSTLVIRKYCGGLGCGSREQVRTFRRRGEHYIGKNSSEGVKPLLSFITSVLDSRGLSISSSDVSNFVELAYQSKSRSLNAKNYGLNLRTCSDLLKERLRNRTSRDAQFAEHYGLLPDESDLDEALKSFIQGTRSQPQLMQPLSIYTLEVLGNEHLKAVVRKGQPWSISNKDASWRAYDATLSDAAAKLFPDEKDKKDICASQPSLTMSHDFYDELLNVMVQRKLRTCFDPPKPYKVVFTTFPENSLTGLNNFVWTCIQKDVESPAIDLLLWKTPYYNGVLGTDWAEIQVSASAAERCAGEIRWLGEWRDLSPEHKVVANPFFDFAKSSRDPGWREAWPNTIVSESWKKKKLPGQPDQVFVFLVNDEQAAVVMTNEASSEVLFFVCPRSNKARGLTESTEFRLDHYFFADKTEMPNQIRNLDYVFRRKKKK